MSEFTDELRNIREQCESGVAGRRIEALATDFSKSEIVLYGAGTLSAFVLTKLMENNIKVACFCDTYRSGVHPSLGLPIISSEELKKEHPEAVVIITSELHGASIMNTLKKIEFPGRIYSFDDLLDFYTVPYSDFEPHAEGYEWAYGHFEDAESRRVILDSMRTRLLGTPMTPSSRPQYFEPAICPLTDSEIFVDGGCFIGDTAEEFIRQTHGNYAHIYGFEPDQNNYRKACANLAGYENIDILHGGLWHMTNTVRFASGALGNSRMDMDGDTIATTFSLDEFFADKQPGTFIKLDVEGAEGAALNGAAGLIGANKPKLAICVYHFIPDMYRLPQRILQLNPEYTLTVRHYSRWYAESVCYAI